ncbi:MAG: hypothetical protein M1820_000660 [Bogoriella megaspora]|nr:MAG: hypothetical protein M1820_000660 [Bogoriella megaspora]
MKPISRPFTLFICMMVALFVAWEIHIDGRSRPPPYTSRPLPDHDPEDLGDGKANAGWAYNLTRDRDDLTLTRDQCLVAFPNLYQEIDRSVAFWSARGGIKPNHVNIDVHIDGAIKVMIYKNQLYVIEAKDENWPWWVERKSAVLHQLHRAIIYSKEPLPNVEFAFAIHDKAEPSGDGGETLWTFCRKFDTDTGDRSWLMPGFSMWAFSGIAGSWKSFQQTVSDIDSDLAEKIPKISWRGNADMNSAIRYGLLDVTRDKSWADVKPFKFENANHADRLDITDFCKYAFVAHTEAYNAWYYHLLNADGLDQNVVAVQDNWSDLEARVQYYLDHEDEAQRIADNTVDFFRNRYLSPAAETCYWRQMFRSFRNVSYEPELYSAEDKMKPRGITFEQYM